MEWTKKIEDKLIYYGHRALNIVAGGGITNSKLEELVSKPFDQEVEFAAINHTSPSHDVLNAFAFNPPIALYVGRRITNGSTKIIAESLSETRAKGIVLTVAKNLEIELVDPNVKKLGINEKYILEEGEDVYASYMVLKDRLSSVLEVTEEMAYGQTRYSCFLANYREFSDMKSVEIAQRKFNMGV